MLKKRGMILAAKKERVKSFVYAASSSTYGDNNMLPKVEEVIGSPLSPYALTKYVNELYSEVFNRCFSFNSIGLRYFNVFGKRQSPLGDYSAVIPRWIKSFINNEQIYINGDGSTSRDFCYIENVVQANIMAATTELNIQRKISKREIMQDKYNGVYNIAVGESTSLNSLFHLLKETLSFYGINREVIPLYQEFRKGDVLHSLANINKAKEILNYKPEYNIKQGLYECMPWYIK
jgi:UDP-N-acetylglucosamine 4-epimerase